VSNRLPCQGNPIGPANLGIFEKPRAFLGAAYSEIELKRHNGRAGEARPAGFVMPQGEGVMRLLAAQMSLLKSIADNTLHICIDKTQHI
jgi:hypothetical protein